MKFLLMHRDDPHAELGFHHSEAVSAELAKLSEEMIKAGVLLTSIGLEPSSKGTRLTFAGGVRSEQEGPFKETRALVAGCALVDVGSRADAVHWATRFAELSGSTQIDVRQVVEMPTSSNGS